MKNKIGISLVVLVSLVTLLAMSGTATAEEVNILPPEVIPEAMFTVPVPPQPGTILLLDDGGSPGQEGKKALDKFGYTYTHVTPAQFATVTLSDYDIIFVAWQPTQTEVDALNARKADIESWISNGGGIVVNAEWKGIYGVTNPYSFLPVTYDTATGFYHTDGVHIVDPTHPLVSGLTDELLGTWGNSVHGKITTIPTDVSVVAIATEYNSPHITEMCYGKGKIVVASSDPEYHVVYGPGDGPWILLYNELSWAAIPCEVILDKTLSASEGELGDDIHVTLTVAVPTDLTVTVVDTLPEEFTYIEGSFTVNGDPATPTVDKQEIAYTIEDPGRYTIEFDVKVTKAYAWKDETVTNVVKADGEEASAEFTIEAFEDLYKEVEEGPEYPVIGVEENWEIGMGLTENPFGYTMTDTKITDRFGGDLKIDCIKAGETTYTFEYSKYEKKKQARVTIETFEGGLSQGTITSDLDKDGVTIGDFDIFWTGRTHKAHFAWTIGPLASGDSTGIIICVSTDTNPAGHQEYTSPDTHELNSGATLKFIDDTGMQLSAVTAPIVVEAVEPVAP